MATNQFGIELSTDVSEKHVKIMWWGASATRKTELILREFPHVFLIDHEGNSDQVDRSEVPPFLVKKTKDPEEVLKMIKLVSEGKIKFPDGSPVETLGLDGGSVLWSVGQELAQKMAENRAARYNKPVDEATLTQLDWGVGKRPLKKIYTAFNNSPIKFLVITCREKDLYEDGGSNNPKKIGVTWDMMKGIEYEVNLVLHLMKSGNNWSFETTKVQGALKKIFPLGKTQTSFPSKELMQYASSITPGTTHDDDEEEVAKKSADKQGPKVEKTQANLLKIATECNIEKASVGKILADAGFSGFNANDWDGMVAALRAVAI